MLLIEGASGKEKSIRRPIGGRAFAEGERPESINDDGRPVGGMERAAVLKLALPGELRGVEGVNAAITVVRAQCPTAKLYLPSVGKTVPDADDWLEIQGEGQSELAERISTLAGEQRLPKAS